MDAGLNKQLDSRSATAGLQWPKVVLGTGAVRTGRMHVSSCACVLRGENYMEIPSDLRGIAFVHLLLLPRLF